MKKVKLYKPTVEDLWFREQCMADPDTMSYNAGYDVSYNGYHYDTGCIDFPKSEWEAWHTNKFSNPNFYYAYIVDVETNEFVGYLNYHLSGEGRYEMGIVMYSKYQGQGYMRPAMQEFLSTAKQNGITALWDSVPASREKALKVFFDFGFEVVEEFNSIKFGKEDLCYIIKKEL